MRFMDKITPWIEREIERQAPTENVGWEGAMGMAPDGPILNILAFMPGAVLGSWISTGLTMANPLAMKEEQADEVVRTLLEQLRNERTRQLAAANGGSSTN